MAFRDVSVIAQFILDELNDQIVLPANVPGALEPFGIDLASFAIIVPNTQWTIQFDDDSEVPDLGRHVLTSEIGAVAQGAPLVQVLAAPLVGLDITVVSPLGVPVAGGNFMTVTVIRHGSVL